MQDSGCCLFSTFMVLHLEGNSFLWGAELESFCPWISTFFFVHSSHPFALTELQCMGGAANTRWPRDLPPLGPKFSCCALEQTSPSPPQCPWLFLLLKKPLRNLSFKPSLLVSLPSFYSAGRPSWGSGFNIHHWNIKAPEGVHITPAEMVGGPTSG